MKADVLPAKYWEATFSLVNCQRCFYFTKDCVIIQQLLKLLMYSLILLQRFDKSLITGLGEIFYSTKQTNILL